MKTTAICFLSFLAVIFYSCTSENKEIMRIRLDCPWEFRQADTGEWMPATVPGTVHTDLLSNGIIEDPFYRLNEKDLQWIDKVDWEYRTTFTVNSLMLEKKHMNLVFEGLDTYADVYMNDQLILQADNMFRTWRVNIGVHLHNGKNAVRIVFRSPVNEGLRRLKEYGIPLAADNDQSETGGVGDQKVSPFIRKAPYHFGWDWGPRLVTSGIWRQVWLEAWDEVRIDNIQLKINELKEKQAEVTVQAEVMSDGSAIQEFRLFVDDSLANHRTANLATGMNLIEIPLTINDPVMWWPNGIGEQKLYRIRVEIGKDGSMADQLEMKTGLRMVRLVQDPDPDGKGESFYFEVNGQPVFSKGANYIPGDVFLPRVSPEIYEFIIRSAAEANINMLRVWGGGIYEDDLFYDLCDQYGILVWQDFMFACAMYPGDDRFLEGVRQEAIDNVKRLRHHPCLVLWCGNNEIEVAWAQWEENRGWGWKQRYNGERRTAIWEAYDTLFHRILPLVVSEFSPEIPYWHSSPSAGFGQLASYETRSGDMHYWGVWHGLHPLSDFRKYRARFMSEYGFQSFPEFNSVKKYTLPEDHHIESEVMMAHQRSGIGNLRIRQYMESDYIIPDDFEKFLYVGQLLQAEAIRKAIESHRADRPYCMGTLYWQLNDCWPVASWSGMDYYGRWKALHYAAKESFKPVILVVDESDGKMHVRVVSDLPETKKAVLGMRLIRFDGHELSTDTLSVRIPAHSSEILYESDVQGIDPASVLLVHTLFDGDSIYDEDLQYFDKPKDLRLPEPGITFTVNEEGNDYLVILESKALAKNVFLTAEGFEGQFSDNFFDVLPGEVVRITFPKSGLLQEFREKLKIMHLQQTF